jgi:hypothetical protein
LFFMRKEADIGVIESENSADVDAEKKERKPRVERRKTLKRMLDNIEFAFESVGLPTHYGWSHTAKDTIIALRKLGAHISPIKRVIDIDSPAKIETLDGKWNALMFVADEKHKIEDGLMGLVFSYAIALRKAPWYVVNKANLPVYECGAAWRTPTGKLCWGNWYVTVNKKTGAVELCTCIKLQNKNVGGAMYMQKIWDFPDIAYAGFDVPKGKEPNVLIGIFVNCFESWQIMDTHWKICVEKNGQRITWTVPQSETKHFFADRDTTVSDDGGKKKKIIHHVTQHVRNLSGGRVSQVREHIRGVSKFGWRGYSDNVVAPKFHVGSHDFIVAGSDEDDITENSVYASKVGKMLADLDLVGARKPLPEFQQSA